MESGNIHPINNAKEIIPKCILNANQYQRVCNFINNYEGLPIDCEIDLTQNFPGIYRLTLRAILEMEMSNHLRSNHWNYKKNIEYYFSKYQAMAKNNPSESCILLNIARAEYISPAVLSRLFLEHIYKTKNKMELSKLIRFPHLIEDELLSNNVVQCLCSDSQNGPLSDFRRRVLGEEYEFKLKEMANVAGLHFDDEKKLRLLGYDKTPDIKMIIPFHYKGVTINWIESKAYFGDVKSHQKNVQQQLQAYCNRFGNGIVIYWFGYHVDTHKFPVNSKDIIIVLDNFPAQSDVEILDLSENLTVTN